MAHAWVGTCTYRYISFQTFARHSHDLSPVRAHPIRNPKFKIAPTFEIQNSKSHYMRNPKFKIPLYAQYQNLKSHHMAVESVARGLKVG
jgi:hypothetical protein